MFQIILLPQSSYWNWVRACRDYVLKFGAHLTSEGSAAASYMAPRQVVTFPQVEGAFAEAGDIAEWFRSNHPDVRLDPVDVREPEALESAFAARIEKEDRFGQKQNPFYMIWPTEYPVITQKFGANPQIYSRYGMPGHEGVDIRALPNTKIFACADGEVYRVEKNPRGQAYGIHVRIRHPNGYRTIYGHLAKSLVAEGDRVQAGQAIGHADSTGASVGSHLHLSLKLDFATDNGATKYPKDIVDPTGYLVWPDSAWSKAARKWPAEKCLVGAHGRAGEPLAEADIEIIEQARLEALVVDVQEPPEVLERIVRRMPSLFLLARLSSDFSEGPVPPKRFVSSLHRQMEQLIALNVRYFEVTPHPNLESDGWGRTWPDGAGFGKWFTETVDRIHDKFPDTQLGFPGLSPGNHIPGRRENQFRFLEQADDSVFKADWIGLNCYWTDAKSMDELFQGKLYEEYRLWYPDKLLMITEFGNPSPSADAQTKASQYIEFYRRLRDTEAIGAAFAFAISAAAGHEYLRWRNPAERESVIASTVGARSF